MDDVVHKSSGNALQQSRMYYYSAVTPRNRYLLKRFGITEDQYNDLYREQDGCCAVCKRSSITFKTKLAVDHDHNSGHIRGLLCNYCNRRIVGRHRKESGANLLLAAYEYLVKEYREWLVPPKIKKKKRVRRKRIKKSK